MASWIDDSDDEGDNLPGFQTATRTVPLSAAMVVENSNSVSPEKATDSKVAVLMDSDSEDEEEEVRQAGAKRQAGGAKRQQEQSTSCPHS